MGGLTKNEVRKIAEDEKLPTARRKDSQGLCFVGKVHLPTFLRQKLASREGDIIQIPANMVFDHDIYRENMDWDEDLLRLLSEPYHFQPSSGRYVGKHNGAHFFTVGQRKGLNVGGFKEPLFVLATDTRKNIIYVGEGQSHPGLHRRGLFIKAEDIHWIRPDKKMMNGEKRNYQVRVRYRQPLQKAELFRTNNGIYIIFNNLQRGITPGQFAAWYDGEELLGSGIING